MTALEDAGPLDDPVRVEAEARVEVVVADDGVGNIATRPEYAHAHQAAATGAG